MGKGKKQKTKTHTTTANTVSSGEEWEVADKVNDVSRGNSLNTTLTL